MNNECRDRLLKIIPMLGSDNDGEALATVKALQRVLKSYNLTFHDLASSVTATTTIPKKNKKTTPASGAKDWTYSPNMPPLAEIVRVCELFRQNHTTGQDELFINQIYLDASILKTNYYMSQLEVARFEEIKRRYNL